MSALKMTNQLLELLPEHERANGNKVFYEKHLKEEEVIKADKKLKGDDGSDELEEDNIVSDELNHLMRIKENTQRSIFSVYKTVQ